MVIDPTKAGPEGTVAGLHVWAAATATATGAVLAGTVVTVGRVTARDEDDDDEEEIELDKDKLIRKLVGEGAVLAVELTPPPSAVAGWMDPATDGESSCGRVRFHQGARVGLDLMPEM